MRIIHISVAVFLCVSFTVLTHGQISGEFPRPIYTRQIASLDFSDGLEGWQVQSRARLVMENGALRVDAVNNNPEFYRRFDSPTTQLRLRLRIKTRSVSSCHIYWFTNEIPRRDEKHKVVLNLKADDNWNDYEVDLPVNGHLRVLSIRMAAQATSSWLFDDIAINATVNHPLLVKKAEFVGESIRYTISNASQNSLEFHVDGITGSHVLAPKNQIALSVPVVENGNLAEANLRLFVDGFPDAGYPVFIYRPEGVTDWIVRKIDSRDENNYALFFEISPDARIGRITGMASTGEGTKQVHAILAPIAHRNGVIPNFTLTSKPNENSLRFDSTDATLNIGFKKQSNEIEISVAPVAQDSQADFVPEFEGPLLRVPGRIGSGLLCGVEFLGTGDTSSSFIDIEEPGNRRFIPNKNWITLPLAAFCVDRFAVGLAWDNMNLQPLFAVPDNSNLSDDNRVSLRGNSINATIRPVISENGTKKHPLSEMVHWAVSRRGLPATPQAPRNTDRQRELCLAAFDGPLLGADKMSWGYYSSPDTPREPYADVLSTLYRLKGTVPRISAITPDGGVLTDDAIYFLANRVQEWKDVREEDVRKALGEMFPDGSFKRRSMFSEVEPTQNTSLGYCARRAAFLLDYIGMTNDRKILPSVEKTLIWMSRQEVPRGGYYWETPLHTPDILSAAYACKAFVRGYELTDNPEYLEQAVRFALLGLPFVYQWSNRPTMMYTTVPMFGASQRQRPWFGTVQPWAGVIYGHSLCLLAKHDTTLDWNAIARGLLHAAEQMQYPSGADIGCIPDTFTLESQMRSGLSLNPCGVVVLRNMLNGTGSTLSIVSDKTDTFVSPFPMQPNRRGVMILGVPARMPFELLINGHEIKQIQGSGSGRDQIAY